MTTALHNTLTKSELALVHECDRDQLAAADEDTLVNLHERVRRARNKYVGLYRRQASARVAEYGGRGKARPKNTRNAEKAEVFEDALSRVSRQLAIVARRSATQLKASRLEAAREARSTAPPTARKTAAPRSQRATTRPTGRATAGSRAAPGARQAARKRQAADSAAGARQQGRRDNR